MVGINKKDENISKNIISIERTQNQLQLAEIYSAANVFLNPTREEVFGLVNIESLACGTPIIISNVGGGPEIVTASTGLILTKNNYLEAKILIEKMYIGILNFEEKDCVDRASEFDIKIVNQEYIKLYQQLVEK